MLPRKKIHNTKKPKTRRIRIEQQDPTQELLQPNHNTLSPISKILGISLNNNNNNFSDYTNSEFNNHNHHHHKSSRYSSKIKYDGNNIIINTQKNNQPVKTMTIRTIRKTNPLGALLIKKYLNGKVTKTLKRHQNNLLPHIHIQPIIPMDKDLGLFTQHPNDDIDNIQLKLIDNNVKLSPLNELPHSVNGIECITNNNNNNNNNNMSKHK